MKPWVQPSLLAIIAAALVSIAVKLWFFVPPTFGDYLSIRDAPAETRAEARKALMRSLPLVRVQGGDVEVSGSVEVTGTVSIE